MLALWRAIRMSVTVSPGEVDVVLLEKDQALEDIKSLAGDGEWSGLSEKKVPRGVPLL